MAGGGGDERDDDRPHRSDGPADVDGDGDPEDPTGETAVPAFADVDPDLTPAALADRAADLREGTDPSTTSESSAPERAIVVLREGFAPALSLYVDARTDGPRLDQEAHRHLTAALNDALAAYAACYGVDGDPSVPVREAAEAFLDTYDLRDTARVLTGVPERNRDGND